MTPQILHAGSYLDDGAAAEPEANALARSEQNDASIRRFARFGRLLDGASLVLLILSAATLTFRPSDLLPALNKAPIYEAFVALCLLTSIPRLLTIAATRTLRSNALVVLAIGMVPAVALSHLANFDSFHARIGGAEMLKACIFAMLVLALVDTPRRVRTMMVVVVAATLAVTLLSLLHYHGALYIPALRAVEQANLAAQEGDAGTLLRLCGIGVFNDPNDFSLLLVVAIAICVYVMCEGRGAIVRTVMIAPLAIFVYALLLTHSRSGFVSAVTALLVYLHVRLGFRNALPAAILLFAGLLAVAWGRQTTFNIDNPEDTFQSRLELWDNALQVFKAAPIFGVGQGRIIDSLGHVVHNSYLQAFSEMGLFGGAIFAGLVTSVLVGLWRARPHSDELRRMRPCVTAIVASYAMGLMSLSRCYTVPTQLVIALGATYLSLAASSGGVVVPPFSARFVARVVVLSLAVLALIYGSVRLLLHVAA